jgi:hypothetical protein
VFNPLPALQLLPSAAPSRSPSPKLLPCRSTAITHAGGRGRGEEKLGAPTLRRSRGERGAWGGRSACAPPDGEERRWGGGTEEPVRKKEKGEGERVGIERVVGDCGIKYE